MKLNYWYHISKHPKDTCLGAAYKECFPENPKGHNELGQSSWKSNFANEIKQLKTAIGLPESEIFGKKSIAKKKIRQLSHAHFQEMDNKAIDDQKEHSLRAFPRSLFTGKPLKYLSITKDRKILTQFRLGDAGLGNRATNPIKTCPVCKRGPNTESHLIFDCPSAADIRARLGKNINFSEFLQLNSNLQNPDIKLQCFLKCTGVSPEALQGRAEFLKSLLEFHNDKLAKTNIDPKTNKPLITLPEKCPLCEFTAHTTRGVKIHKGRVHKNIK